MDRIVITHWELNDEHAHSPNLYKDSSELAQAIVEYAERQLTPKNIEIFKQEKKCSRYRKRMLGCFL